jgi:tetratricopeptide (TPR) repeat protein
VNASTNKSGHASQPTAGGARPRTHLWTWLALLIVGTTAAVYWPVFGFEFLNYDDPEYITANPHVYGGLTRENILWAFAESHAANWHPLTWLSHQLDCTLFGLDPGPPHVVNLVLHLANTLLLLGLLRAMGLSALAGSWIAAAFALHPAHLESVAWVSERKDVLSTFFGLIALRAYLGYARSPSARRYLTVTIALLLGLLAKPMLVTLPVLFLLLDHWPLARFTGARGAMPDLAAPPAGNRRLLLEKLPWFFLAAASAAITIAVQETARSDLSSLGLAERMQTAIVGVGRYILKLVWPQDSAVLYLHPYLPGGTPYSSYQVIGSALLVATLTGLVLATWRRGWPILGWFWFLVMLAPVCGLVQVGSQAIADRYTYLSFVGLCILLAQLASPLPARAPAMRAALRVLAWASILACTWSTHSSVGVWRNSETLFLRTLEVEPDNPFALVKLGGIRDAAMEFESAEAYYRAAVTRLPRMTEAQLGLATTLNRSGRASEAIREYERAIELDPTSATAYTNHGLLLSMRGQTRKGIQSLERAYQLSPESAVVLRNLGLAYHSTGDLDRAEGFLQSAFDAGPDAMGSNALGSLLNQRGRPRQALTVIDAALQCFPDNPELHNAAAQACASLGETVRLRAHLSQLARLKPSALTFHHAGVLLMQVGAVDEAIAEFERALQQNPALHSARQALEAARDR